MWSSVSTAACRLPRDLQEPACWRWRPRDGYRQQPDPAQNRELIADMYADLGELERASGLVFGVLVGLFASKLAPTGSR